MCSELQKNVQNTVLKMELPPLCVVAHCLVHLVICSFTTQIKSAVEIHTEVCSVYGNCMSIQMIWQWRKHTSLNFNSWFVSNGKKTNNHEHLIRCDYTQWQLHLQYWILFIFVKWLLRNFYSGARNTPICMYACILLNTMYL